MQGSVTYQNEDIFVAGKQIIGIDSVNSSIDRGFEPIMVMGTGFIGYSQQSEAATKIDFSMYSSDREEEILQNIDTPVEISYLYKTKTDESYKKWIMESGILASYEISCSVGEYVKSKFSFEGLGKAGFYSKTQSLEEGDFDVLLARPGDIVINGDIFEDNFLQSFTFRVEVPITKKHIIGGQFIPTYAQNNPIKVTAEFGFNLQEVTGIAPTDVFCEDEFSATISLNNCGTNIRDFSISNARMTSMAHNGSVGSRAEFSVTYETSYNSYEEVKSLLGIS